MKRELRDEGVDVEPDTTSGAHHRAVASCRPHPPDGPDRVGSSTGPPSGSPADLTDQLTQRIIGASRSTGYGLLQAHERALREIADCRPSPPGQIPASEWFQTLVRAHAIFIEEACTAYIADAGPVDPPDHESVRRITDLHGQIRRRLRGAEPAALGEYAILLRAVVDFVRDTLGADDREWIQVVAGSATHLLDQLTDQAGV